MSARTLRCGAFVLGVAAALAAAPGYSAPSSGKDSGKTTFRWVDEQGVIHYSDSVPPPAVGRDREVMNAEGVPVRHLDGQRSPEQIAADARARAEVVKRKQHDTFLITTYTSVKDIEALRDSRLEQLKTQSGAAQQYIESLKSRLTTLQTRAVTFRPYNTSPGARRMPDDLAEDLVRTVNEMNTQSAARASQSEEVAKLRAQFQADIERYRELHTLHSHD